MYKREHHNYINQILQSLDSDMLQKSDCYFGGGTAISLMLNEYRESVDIDFLCGTNEGYSFLMEHAFDGLRSFFKTPTKFVREPKIGRDAVRMVIDVNDIPIKFEIIRSGKASLKGGINPQFGVPTLSREELFSEKLLANASRGLDRAFLSRDIIDLGMMIAGWKHIPEVSWLSAFSQFKSQTVKKFNSSISLIENNEYFKRCLDKMQINDSLSSVILDTLHKEQSFIPELVQESIQKTDKAIKIKR